MRNIRFTACLAALVCGACAAHVVAPPVASDEIVPVYRQPAGYYPGIILTSSSTPQFAAWLAEHHAGIEDIQSRIVEVREGRRAPGCIGEDRYTCVASLAQKFAIADSYFTTDSNIFADTKSDVNGKPIIPKITFDGYVPEVQTERNRYAQIAYDFSRTPTQFFLTLGPDGVVSKLEARLAKDPTFARTQEDYDGTNAYETISALTAKTCPALGRAEVAKWIENTIKPNSKSYQGKIKRGVAALKISQRTKFCGRTFQFDSVWAARTYNQYRRDVKGGMFLIVE